MNFRFLGNEQPPIHQLQPDAFPSKKRFNGFKASCED